MIDALPSGTRFGPYEVLRPLGAGGMGVVYVARDVRLGREVALKLLPAALANDERRQRFLREARTAAAVKHRSIAQIYDVADDPAQPWLAMELIDGETLAEVLKRGPLPSTRALAVCSEIASGLARAHEAHVVHRDLKPGNVMLDRDGQVKLLDFGLARVLDEGEVSEGSATATGLTGAGRVLGTPGYMAPEQARGMPVDARADLFSLGVMLLEMLTGRPTFPGADPMGRIVATLRDKPDSLDQIRADVSADQFALVNALLSKDPADRPQSALDVVKALAVAGPPPGPGERPRVTGSASSRPGRWALGLGGLLATAGIAWLVREPQTPPRVPPVAAQADVRTRLLDPASMVACLPFRVTGDRPLQRLGEIAAMEACHSLAAWTWTTERFHGPARLLNLDALSQAEVPASPFASDAGVQQLAQAAAQRALIVTGSARIEGGVSRVTLTIEGPGVQRVEVSRSGELVTLAVIDAITAMMDQLGVPPTKVPDEARDFIEFADGRARVAFRRATAFPPTRASERCEALASLSKLDALESYTVCRHPEVNDAGVPLWPPGAADEIAQMSGLRRTFWDLSAGTTLSPDALRAAAALMREARGRATDPMLVSELAIAEARAWDKLGDQDAMRTALDLAARNPESCGSRTWRSFSQRDLEPALRALTTSCSSFGAWQTRGQLTADRASAMEMFEVAYELSGRTPQMAEPMGEGLFEGGLIDRVRGLASFHLDRNGPDDALAGQYLLALTEWGEGQLRAAHTRLSAPVLTAEALTWSHAWLINAAFQTGALLGDRRFADAYYERFVLDPSRRDRDTSIAALLRTLDHASPNVARKVLVVLRAEADRKEKDPSRELLLRGYEKLYAGDAAGAAQLWRVKLGNSVISPTAFLRGGEPALAEKHLRMMIDRHHGFVSPLHAALAELLSSQGRVDEARALATKFVEAHQRTDEKVAQLDAMQALVRTGRSK